MGTVPTGDSETRIDMDKNEVGPKCFLNKVTVNICLHYPDFASCIAFGLPQKEPSVVSGMHRSKSKHELKLLEKIPENAEATVVLVGELCPPNFVQLKYSDCFCVYVDCYFPLSFRQCGLPGAAHHGVCAAAGGRGAGVRPGGPRAGQVSVRPVGTRNHQHGLSPDRTLHLHTHVRQGEV